MVEKKPEAQPQPRPHFWMWGDAVTIRNPIREAWEAKQKTKRREQLDIFLREREEETGE